MTGIRILHCADFHLGSEFLSIKSKGRERRQDMLQTFQTVLRLCKDEQVQFLLIAGDLFDSVHVSADILELVRNGFAGLSPTIVAISPGNHDPYTQDSPYVRKDFWPDNVIIFNGSYTYKDFPEYGVRLWGAAFTGAYQHEPLLSGVYRPEPDMVNLGVLHGALIADRQDSDYNPIWRDYIRTSGLDYLALGHVHKFDEVCRCGGTFFSYSGCPEGRGFDEQGAKGVVMGIVAPQFCDLRFVPVCRRECHVLPVDITDVDRSQIEAHIRKHMVDQCGEGYRSNLYKVMLRGTLHEDPLWSMENIRAELSDVFYCKFVDQTVLAADESDQADYTTLRGIFIRRMTEKIKDADDSTAQLAFKLGLRAFLQKVDYDED